MSWWEHARCAKDEAIQEILKNVKHGGLDPFFLTQPSDDQKQWLRRYCAECPVRLACLAEANKTLSSINKVDWVDGWWGGMSRRERVIARNRFQKDFAAFQQRTAPTKEQSPDSEDPIAS